MNSRRKFLKQIGMVSGAIFIADSILADPYKPLLINPLNKNYIRVKGSVTQNSKPVKDVVVSDGVSVTATTSDGTYELNTDSNQEFIFISIPAGYKIPISKNGTAYFYKRITHNTSNEQVIDFNLEKSKDDNDHTFLLFADPQTLDMDDITRFNNETINDVNKFYPGKENLFVVSCGDIMFDHLELFPEYEKAIAKTGLPYFQVLGNHDVDRLSRTDEKSHLTFQNFFGPRYYSFNKGEVHYVVMDNIFWYGDYIGYFDQPQLDWLQKDLEYIEKGKTVVVFCHIPPNNFSSERNDSSDKASITVVNRELLYSILKGYKSYIITGHMHESEFISEQG
ncbi:MAG: metallophosphoesterase N-terminal domain-containing protein, partial [Ignavibacteriaceae bacterium]